MKRFDHDRVLVSRRVALPEGVRPAAVVVRGESIAAVLPFEERPIGLAVMDLGDLHLLPGLIDSHVHINEPGRTDWEGFATATKAAAAGGITTLVDMPLNSSPVTTTLTALREKQAAADGQIRVDCGFHAGIVPGNFAEIPALIEAGVCGFKAFLCHSGIDDFPNATAGDLRQAMPLLAAADVPLLVHAELLSPLPEKVQEAFASNPKSYAAYLATRPVEWEVKAIQLMIGLCRETGCRVHIVHLAAATEARAMLATTKRDGLAITVETCPHYLTFAAEEIPDGDTRFKCAPPLRERFQRAALRAMVLEGKIDTLGSDHSPAPPELKLLHDGDLSRAWGGIASLQLLLPASWTAIGNASIFPLLIQNPAALCGLADCKGAIVPGRDADLVIFDADAEFVVDAERLEHRHKASPYDGLTLKGQVLTTYLRGQPIFDRGEFLGEPSGRLLERGRRR